MQVIQLVAIETRRATKSPEGLILSRKEEIDDLMAALDRLVHAEHSNPERVGCPGHPALTRLTTESATLGSDSILAHIRNCAACLDELKELRLATKPSH